MSYSYLSASRGSTVPARREDRTRSDQGLRIGRCDSEEEALQHLQKKQRNLEAGEDPASNQPQAFAEDQPVNVALLGRAVRKTQISFHPLCS
jgi:hypothetical protein